MHLLPKNPYLNIPKHILIYRCYKKREKECEQKKKHEKESEQKKESDKKQVTENLREKERKTNFYARASEVKRALFLNKPTIVLFVQRGTF